MHCAEISAEFEFGVIAPGWCGTPKIWRSAMTLGKSSSRSQLAYIIIITWSDGVLCYNWCRQLARDDGVIDRTS